MITRSYRAMCFPHVAEIPLKKGVCQSCPDRPAHRAGRRENCRCHEKKPVAQLAVLPAATRPSA